MKETCKIRTIFFFRYRDKNPKVKIKKQARQEETLRPARDRVERSTKTLRIVCHHKNKVETQWEKNTELSEWLRWAAVAINKCREGWGRTDTQQTVYNEFVHPCGPA